MKMTTPAQINMERKNLKYQTMVEFVKAMIISGKEPELTEDDLMEDDLGEYVIEGVGNRILVERYNPKKNHSEVRYSIYTTYHQRIAREAALLAQALDEQL